MSHHCGARTPAFSRLMDIPKAWYKKYTARRNRKKLRQSRDIEEHCDRKLEPWALD